ncbi:AsmA family protein [mine drainage metagenome]|uniref:AsmA family protein n=1 Tax=mine drainage metagenome TaxID=410659 RepID=A0A1J5R1F2_9ZZZZ
MKRIAGVVVVLAALILIVPFLIPTGTYLKQIEQIASEKLGQPVSIGSLHFAVLPTPRANIDLLRIGQHDEVRVERVAIIPEISSLFSEVKVMSAIVVTNPVMKMGAFDFIAAMPEKVKGSPALVVRRLEVINARLEWPQLNVPAVNVKATMAEGNQLQSAKLTSVDGKLNADITPQGAGYGIKLVAQQWTLPAGPKVLFNSLHSEMTLQGSRLDIGSLDARLYQGTLTATAVLEWGKELHASGKFRTEGIAIAEAAHLISKKKLLSGKLGGTGTFSVNAKEAARAADNLVLDYKFNVANGVLHGVDLVKAATLLLRKGGKGGETQFDELSGMLHVAGKQIELKELDIVSGLLAASGGVKISPAGRLDGVVEVKLKKGVVLVGVPLQVSGTLDDPAVFPTKTAMAGAAIGTGMLGPGVGTSLGLKAASGVEKIKGLFDNKK